MEEDSVDSLRLIDLSNERKGRIFNIIKSQEKFLKNNTKFYGNLNPDEIKALRFYSIGGAFTINELLFSKIKEMRMSVSRAVFDLARLNMNTRDIGKKNRGIFVRALRTVFNVSNVTINRLMKVFTDEMNDVIQSLDSALVKGRTLNKDTKLYRGLNGQIFPELIFSDSGTIITFDNYLSTSLDINVSLNFSDRGKIAVLMEIELTKNTKSIFLPWNVSKDFLDTETIVRSELEVLLPRKGKFEIVSRREVDFTKLSKTLTGVIKDKDIDKLWLVKVKHVGFGKEKITSQKLFSKIGGISINDVLGCEAKLRPFL